MNQREDPGIGADAEGQRQRGGEGEAFGGGQLPQGEADVAEHI